MLTRRTTLATLAAMLAPAAVASTADPVFAALARAVVADDNHLRAGAVAVALYGPDKPRPASWQAHRAGITEARRLARYALHDVTPTTPEGAAALVAFYAAIAEWCGHDSAVKAARRKLRRVFARPGAPPMPVLPSVIAPPG